MTPFLQRLYHLPLVGWVLRHRFPRFAVVGASGTVVNLVVLYLGQEFLFRAIEPEGTRLNFSLSLAVFVATINNFTWNRLWTWSDRVRILEADEQLQPVGLRVVGMEFGQYVTASAFGSGLQYVLTLLLTGSMDYRVANIIAILAASVSNFLANDRWTFKRHKKE